MKQLCGTRTADSQLSLSMISIYLLFLLKKILFYELTNFATVKDHKSLLLSYPEKIW